MFGENFIGVIFMVFAYISLRNLATAFDSSRRPRDQKCYRLMSLGSSHRTERDSAGASRLMVGENIICVIFMVFAKISLLHFATSIDFNLRPRDQKCYGLMS